MAGHAGDSVDSAGPASSSERQPDRVEFDNAPRLAGELAPPDGESARIPGHHEALALEVAGVDLVVATAYFLTPGAWVVQEDVVGGRVLHCPPQWTDVVITFPSGEKIYRNEADVPIEADGVRHLRGSLDEAELSLVAKGRVVAGLTPRITAVQASPAPPAPLGAASAWSTGTACELLGPGRLAFPFDRGADSIQLQIEQPFALSAVGSRPGSEVLLSPSDLRKPVQLWWPTVIRCRLTLPDDLASPQWFAVQWEFFDLDGQPLRGEQKRLQTGGTYAIASPVGSASVLLEVFDGGASPVAVARGALLRRDQLFEIELDPRTVSFLVSDQHGRPIGGVDLRSGGVDLAATSDAGTAEIARHAVTSHGLQLRHANYDTEIVRTDEIQVRAESGLPCRVTLVDPTTLRLRATGPVPRLFLVSVPAADLRFEELEEGIDFPEVEGLCGADEDNLYFCSEGPSEGVVEIKGDFTPRAFSEGVTVVIRDSLGNEVCSKHAALGKGRGVELEVEAEGFETFSGKVVSATGDPVVGAELGAGFVYGSARALASSDAQGAFSFHASARLRAIAVSRSGFTTKEISAEALRTNQPIVLEDSARSRGKH